MIHIDILNKGYSPDERFMMHEFNGEPLDLPDHVLDAVREIKGLTWNETLAFIGSMEPGEWIVIVDDTIVSDDEFCPYHVHWEADDVVSDP